METPKNHKWYVLKATANQERKVKENIEKELRYNELRDWVPQIIVPTEKLLTLVNGKKSFRERIIMPGYLFIQADLSHGELAPLLESISGVYGFLSLDEGKVTKTPIELKAREIERFINIPQQLEASEATWDYQLGERVKILDGVFKGFEGVIGEIDEQQYNLRVMVSIFSRQTPVDVSFTQAEKIVSPTV